MLDESTDVMMTISTDGSDRKKFDFSNFSAVGIQM